jgi:hypothetical protein
MIECPYCYRVYRQPPEKLGARCPKCKMPLYEDPSKRRKTPDKDYGRCDQHPDAQALAKCSRCDRPMCQTCRTRWHEEPVCPRCVDESIADDEPGPREAQLQTKHAWTSVILATVGWMVLLMTLAPYSQFHAGQVRPIIIFITYFLFLGSFVPAVFGVGCAVSAIRLRGDFGKLATCGLVGAGTQLGLAIGLIVINIWHN